MPQRTNAVCNLIGHGSEIIYDAERANQEDDDSDNRRYHSYVFVFKFFCHRRRSLIVIVQFRCLV